MRYFVYVAILTGFICSAPLHNTESKASVQIEPYSEDSLQIIEQSMERYKDNYKKLVKLFARIQKAIDECNASPAGKDIANLMHSMLLFSCLEFTKSASAITDVVIPELEKYKTFLQKTSELIVKDPASAHYSKQLEEDVQELNVSLNELRNQKETYVMIQRGLIDILIDILLKDHQGSSLKPWQAYVLLCR